VRCIRDHVLRRTWLVIGDVIDRVRTRALDGCHQNLRDVGSMDAIEDLSRLDEASRCSIRDFLESVATRSVDTGEAEDLNRGSHALSKLEPLFLRGDPVPGAFIDRAGWSVLVNPSAVHIAVNTDR
jgi:hypothetical protein